MRTIILSVLCFFFFLTPAFCASRTFQIGTTLSTQADSDVDLQQYELFLIQPLGWPDITMGNGSTLFSNLEYSIGYLDHTGPEGGGTFKFAIMPLLVFSPQTNIDFIVGFGAGYMTGDTKYSTHDLGGPFFLHSKLGMIVTFFADWNIGFTYYHQSNAGIYEHNNSLNMLQFSVGYSF